MKTLVSRKDSAVTNNLPTNWTGDEGEGEPLGTRVFCPHLLDVRWMRGWRWEAQDEELKWKKKKKLPSGGSFCLILQLPMLKEVKTKTLVSRKDSAVTNNLPSNWTGDEGEGEPLGTRVFCPYLLDVKGMGVGSSRGRA
ncbi:hypothetical protein CDAR_466271 [Caerostris darwini]|uniref:Uncharacterized protein n=1 Tax=Caerostris darwini TaxID=1538125 RepID=A0AAV4WRT9_9ARAC|nr:hypothetical protein CDAR_466271 [Caerostris darwini]